MYNNTYQQKGEKLQGLMQKTIPFFILYLIFIEQNQNWCWIK